jgi:hypothetical protein
MANNPMPVRDKLFCGVEQWKFGRPITSSSQVRFLPLHPISPGRFIGRYRAPEKDKRAEMRGSFPRPGYILWTRTFQSAATPGTPNKSELFGPSTTNTPVK